MIVRNAMQTEVVSQGGHDAPIPETLGGEEDIAKATKAVTANIKKISWVFRTV